jgi:DNA-binding response OmpR family regulator
VSNVEDLSITQDILAVFPPGENRSALEAIFLPSPWTLRAAATLAEAGQALHEKTIGAVIADSRFPGWHWIDLLRMMQAITNPPPLIVADRLADERLWAEVLNLGGHDLLATPFDAKEVLYAVGMACRRWENHQQMIALRQLPRRSEPSEIRATRTRAAHGGR